VYVSEAANRGDPDDYIEVYNNGSEECTLAGFQLDDSEELEDFTFGNIILAPGDFWIGYEDSTDSFNSGLGGGVDGDSIMFADADGSILITILEQSLETLDGIELSQSFGSNGEGCYTFPTPGESNVDCYEFIIGCTDPDATNYDPDANADDGSCEYSTTSCILGDVYVSEAANRGDPDDYVEVYNNGIEECTLAGFQLDDSEELEDFTFGYVILAPYGYWLGYEDAEDSFNSGLGGEGDSIVFADSDGNMLIVILEESIEIADGVELSQSYGSDGIGCYTLPTPGASNADCFEFIYGCTNPEANNYDVGANTDDGNCEYSTVFCLLGDVYVSEAANRGDPDDYIEVYNNGSEECTLAGFQLDDSEELEDFTFGNIILSPGDFWIGYEDAEDSFSSGLNADGDIVVFADEDGSILITILEQSLETLDGIELSQSYGSDGTGCYTLPNVKSSNSSESSN
jgi:hypothetical protein